jgi:trans-L-3-hydroxyproline dehydratase
MKEAVEDGIRGNSSAASSSWIDTEDWHTAGEPFRIIKHLPRGHLPNAASVAQRRAIVLDAISHPLDTLRRTLCHEPRGHADMYGGFITPPDDSGAHFGVLFWHKDGFSTACGHGTIALGFWAVCSGLVESPKEDGMVDVVVDVPSGRVKARVMVENGKPIHADFINVRSYQLTDPIMVPVSSSEVGVLVKLSYGGTVYASVNAEQLSLSVEPANIRRLVDLGREIRASLSGNLRNLCELHDDVYGVIFFEDESQASDRSIGIIRERNITIFADGQVDRSPCGSGTCARLAIHFTERKIGIRNGSLVNRSVIGTVFEGSVVSKEEDLSNGYSSCIPMVRGTAYLVGKMSFHIDPEDPIYPGFLL